ncbi:hypothetical protein D9V32_04440 [Mycetocola tolaasinivorans]|uniref:SIR2-like domain-containing protein n=1 Tax=Mycetocola tolaasinivorans TaxID=76635 RepID=A0A3L7A9N0_9MICO|nr:hypothetical protein D9V32_04440 [Mycetocola tolaasinivorans]
MVYCGAGVTRDRTGLGWSELVSEVFDVVRGRRNRDHDTDAAIAGALARPDLDPAQKASVVVEAGRASRSTETGFMRPILHRVLYKQHGWSQGRLLQNVAELAVFTAGLGDDISIVTTNYDDYIDRQIHELIRDYYQNATPKDDIPGVVLNIVGAESEPFTQRAAQNGAGTIYIHHIHGRVDSSGASAGQIVFSESSYSRTRNQTVQFLVSQFTEASAFLSVGASLSDAPLIEALFQADAIGRWRERSPVKVALLTPLGDTPAEKVSGADFAIRRGLHLGIDVLVADTFSNIAQFVEELRVCKVLNARTALESYVPRASYSHALASWWSEWSTAPWHQDHDAHHQLLAAMLANVSDFFRSRDLLNRGEVLRLEAWIRINPSVSQDNRHLTHYANSTGPLYAQEALRRERIVFPTNVASVRAFTVGKPLLLGLGDLEHSDQASRWKSFLTVPITHDVEVDFESFEVSRTVPVGVLTLASTHPRDGAGRSRASFAKPALSVADYETILGMLRDVGRMLVSPEGPPLLDEGEATRED